MVAVLRRTKIVATLGPATDDPAVLADLVRAGVDVVRLNFSHGSLADHSRRVDLMRRAARQAGRYVGVLGDLQGPKIRIDRFVGGKALLKDAAEFMLDASLAPEAGTDEAVGIAYKKLPQDVFPGDVLLLNDGQISLQVLSTDGPRIRTRVLVGGELGNNKGINRQGGGLSAGALTDKDREDIRTAAQLRVDFLAVSFARDAADMDEARKLLRGAGGHALLIAKIERAEAIRNLAGVVRASDGVMVARGDLGVEMGYAELAGLQKQIIQEARHQNRVVIMATQMMESMITSTIPTRAEVSDVANAVMDGTDAVMLSAETASGKHPPKVVEAMAQIIVGAEKYQVAHVRVRQRTSGYFGHSDEAIAAAVMYTANHLHVRAIVALTESGSTPLWMSRVRSDIPVYAFTRHESTRSRVCLYRGVYPVAYDVTDSGEAFYFSIFRALLDLELVEEGDSIILTKGELSGVAGGTNSMQILKGARLTEAAEFQGTDRYIATDELMAAVNAAMVLSRPLLIKGEPGTGKTLLAAEIARSLGKPFFEWHIKSTTKAQQGLYEYDAVSRLRDSQLGDPRVKEIRNYIVQGHLWEAFACERQPVLLIDEIDKADIEFPNDLLRELDRMEFYVYETHETVRARHRPVIVITSNNERELPDAFLRRCFFHYIRFPDAETMTRIVEVHFPELKRELLGEALGAFFRIRETPGLKKKPTTSELLDWIKLLLAEDIPPEALRSDDAKKLIPPLYGALLKNEQDVHLFEQLVFLNRRNAR